MEAFTKPQSFGIWGNTDKPRFWELLEPILKWAEQKKNTSSYNYTN